MRNITKGSKIYEEIINILRDNREEIGLVDRYPKETQYGIFYGPEKVFAYFPVIIVDEVYKNIELTATGLRGTFLHTVNLIVCHYSIGKATTNSRLESLKRAETIEEIFWENPTLNDSVIHGYITSIDDGIYHNENKFYFAHQLVWQGFVKERVTQLT